MQHLVAVAPTVPHPQARGAGEVFTHHYLQQLSRDWKITLIATGDDKDPPADRAYQVITTDSAGASAGKLVRGARRIHRETFPLTLGNPQPVVEDPRCRQVVAAASVIEMHHSQELPCFRALKTINSTAVYGAVEHDLNFQSLHRRSTSWGPLKRTLGANLLRYRQHQELTYLRQCESVGVFKTADRTSLVDLGIPADVPVVLAPWLDYPSDPQGPLEDPIVLFTGAMARAENWRSALWFLDEVWPRVISKHPSAQFVVAGSNPPPELRSRVSASVRVTGDVPDLLATYRAARVMVAPLRFGAGLKFKVPQAMLFELPVVGTDIAFEGVDLDGDLKMLCANDPSAMATELIDLLKDYEKCRRLGALGRAAALRQFDFAASVANVSDRYRSLITSR